MAPLLASLCFVFLFALCGCESNGARPPAASEAEPEPPPVGCSDGPPCIAPDQIPFFLAGDGRQAWVRGSGFGEAGRLLVAGVEVAPLERTDRLVRFRLAVPPAADGEIRVETAGGAVATAPFLAVPRLLAVEPLLDVAPNAFELTGTGFGAAPGAIVYETPYVTVEDPEIVSWTPERIEIRHLGPSGGHIVRVRRTVSGDDGAPLASLTSDPVDAHFELRPVVTSVDCRVTQDEECVLHGSFGAGYMVTANGKPVSLQPSGQDTVEARFLLPKSIEPGPVTLVVTSAEGHAAEPVLGKLLGWKRIGAAHAWFGRPRALLAAGSQVDVVVQSQPGNTVMRHTLVDTGLVPSCGTLQPEPSPLRFARDGTWFYALAGGAAGEGGFLHATLLRCPVKPNAVDSFVIVTDHGLAGPASTGGVAATGSAVYALVRDEVEGRSDLLKLTNAETQLTVVASAAALGTLHQAGSTLFLAGGDPLWSGELFRVDAEAFVPIDPPWSTPPAGLPFVPFFATDGQSRLVTLADGAGGDPVVVSWSPGTSTWTEVAPVPADLGVPVSSALDTSYGDLLLTTSPDGAGGDRLFAWQRSGSTWTPLHEDLVESPGCSRKLLRAEAVWIGPGKPLVLWQTDLPCGLETASGLSVLDWP